MIQQYKIPTPQELRELEARHAQLTYALWDKYSPQPVELHNPTGKNTLSECVVEDLVTVETYTPRGILGSHESMNNHNHEERTLPSYEEIVEEFYNGK